MGDAYNQRSARFSRRPMATPAQTAAAMAAQGRSLSTSGQYKTTPGAPLVGTEDSITGLQRNARTGLSTNQSWDDNFISHRPVPQPLAPDSGMKGSDIAPPATDSQFYDSSVGTLEPQGPTASDPNSYVAHAIASQDKYFNSVGAPIARPKPGAVQSGTSIQTPYGTASVQSAVAPSLSMAHDDITTPDSFDQFFSGLPVL